MLFFCLAYVVAPTENCAIPDTVLDFAYAPSDARGIETLMQYFFFDLHPQIMLLDRSTSHVTLGFAYPGAPPDARGA
eukprot:1158891-Pelagomonas_calceolata.AAC.9